MVRATGLEPARGNHWNLNPTCLPIPPRPHVLDRRERHYLLRLQSYSITNVLLCQEGIHEKTPCWYSTKNDLRFLVCLSPYGKLLCSPLYSHREWVSHPKSLSYAKFQFIVPFANQHKPLGSPSGGAVIVALRQWLRGQMAVSFRTCKQSKCQFIAYYPMKSVQNW